MDAFPVTSRTRLRRKPGRGSYDRATVHAILDEGLVCHVGFVIHGEPFVVPATYARIGERLYLHGAVANRMLRTLAAGVPVCVTVTHLDGLVLARSAMHHSMNYRSVMLFGIATLVTDPEEKRRALEATIEHMVPGRSAGTRAPNEQELRATSVLVLPVEEASAKIRHGPPSDDAEDLELPFWAGVIPLRPCPLDPVPDEHTGPNAPVPPEVTSLLERARAELSANRS